MNLPADTPSTDPPSAGRCRRRGLIVISMTVGVFVVLTVIGVMVDVDRRVASIFFSPDEGWSLGAKAPWLWLYRYGTIPGVVFSIGALLVWGMSFIKGKLIAWRYHAMLIVLTSVIGAGFLVNTILKPYWGRPRPDQTVAFGSLWEYRHVHQPGTPGKGESFPCGHCTMGYVFTAMFFLYRRAPRLAVIGGTAGLVMGGLLSAARIVQGAHYLLDTMWSLGVILLTAQALYYLVLRVPVRGEGMIPTPAPLSRRQRLWMTVSIFIAVAVMAGAFSTRRPFYRTFNDRFDAPLPGTHLILKLSTEPSRFNVRYTDIDSGLVSIDSRGFGWIDFKFRITKQHLMVGKETILDYDIQVGSYFSELRHGVTVTLPKTLENELDVRLVAQNE